MKGGRYDEGSADEIEGKGGGEGGGEGEGEGEGGGL